MKILNKFIWSKKEPSNKNDIWFDGSTWRMYTEEAWQSFTLPVDAADKVAKVIENASEVYQEKLNAGYGIVIEGNTISLDRSSIDNNSVYNIGSIEIFDNAISTQEPYYLTNEDIQAIKGGKLITTTYGDMTIPAFGVSGGGTIIHMYFYAESKLYDIGIVDDGVTPCIFPYFCRKVDILLYRDDFLSEISENSVQNKVITAELNKKLNKTDVATINGQSLVEGGNITIPTGGELYDDTEIKQQITELSEEIEGKEDKANKTTTLSSASTDTQYPSARAAFMAISKKSEVSLEALANGNLKVTIDGVSKDFMAATPSGDPMHYNYIVVGALYNDTDSAIARTDYFGNAVSHLPGRWYVEGLGDLTNAEMREVYEAGKWWANTDNRGFSSHIGARAILRCPAYEQVIYKGDFNFIQAFNNCPNMEVVNLFTHPVQLAEPSFNRIKVNHFDFGCQGSPKIKYIYGIIDATAASGDSSYWLHTAGLIEVRLLGIKVGIKFPLAKNISKASILYMIENEAATNAITITLHADAYARLSADADIVAALAAHPLVSLAKA